MDSLLFKILNYENKIFEEYISKRTTFLENLKTIKINELSKEQLLNFINDIKNIIDPLKTSISSIDDYFLNLNLNFTKGNDDDTGDLVNYLFLGYFFTLISSELTELKSESESELSDNVSELSVSSSLSELV